MKARKSANPAPVAIYSWYFSTSNCLLCVGPKRFNDPDWRELEDATEDIANGHMIITADWSKHVMEHDALRVWTKHNLPKETKLERRIPNV